MQKTQFCSLLDEQSNFGLVFQLKTNKLELTQVILDRISFLLSPHLLPFILQNSKIYFAPTRSEHFLGFGYVPFPVPFLKWGVKNLCRYKIMTRSKNEAIQFLMISNALVIDFYAFTLIVTFSKYHTADICRLNSVQSRLWCLMTMWVTL